MPLFNEQIVKRQNKTKQLVIKILAVTLTILIPAICVLIAPLTNFYIAIVGFFLLLGGIYACWYTITSQSVEFEYAITSDELNIAKVIALRKRKRLLRFPISTITKITKDEKEIDNGRYTKTVEACRDIDAEDENYYAVINHPALGNCLLIFSPNEQMLNAMKPHLSRDVVLKLFYNRDAR